LTDTRRWCYKDNPFNPYPSTRGKNECRTDATAVEFGGCKIQVASLSKIIQSRKVLGRLKDVAIIDILEKTLDEKEKARQ